MNDEEQESFDFFEDNDDDTITVNITDSSLWSSLTSDQSYYTMATPSYGTITIPTTGGTGATYSNYTLNSSYISPTTSISANGNLVCKGDAEFEGDVKIGGKSVKESLNAIEKRLSILVPDPKKLAKYEALQKAYEHYKVLEAMCSSDDDG